METKDPIKETEFRKRLCLFFRNMRREGYIAHQNWKCCSSCGWAAIPEDKGEKVIFYHNQDNVNIPHFVYITWSGDGSLIATKAQDAGFIVNWNGDKSQRMQLILKENIYKIRWDNEQ